MRPHRFSMMLAVAVAVTCVLAFGGRPGATEPTGPSDAPTADRDQLVNVLLATGVDPAATDASTPTPGSLRAYAGTPKRPLNRR